MDVNLIVQCDRGREVHVIDAVSARQSWTAFLKDGLTNRFWLQKSWISNTAGNLVAKICNFNEAD